MSRPQSVIGSFLLIFLSLQLFQPVKNKGTEVPFRSIRNVATVPLKIQSILKKSCYDCHSNSTRYPWYGSVQPAAWFLAHHIEEGKAELNFDEYESYSIRKQISKLRAIEGVMEDHSMPLSSYTFLHPDTKLSDVDRAAIRSWAVETQDTLEKNKP